MTNGHFRFAQRLSILVVVFGMGLPAGSARSQARTDESLGHRRGDDPGVRERAGEDVVAIGKVAAYLDKMGRKDVGDALRADFKSGKIHVARVDANAELTAGILGLGRSLAISDSIIGQTGTPRYTSEAAVAGWALTIVHEYVHLKQWLPMEDSWHETPAWAATIKENGLWIRRTLDEIQVVRKDASLTPQERAQRLTALRVTLKALHGNFEVTLNELRDKTAKGELDKDHEWKGVPPAGSTWVEGTANLDALEKLAAERVHEGYEDDAAPGVMLTFCLSAPIPETANVGVRVYGDDGIDYGWLGLRRNAPCTGYRVAAGHFRAIVNCKENRKDRDRSLAVESAREYKTEFDVVAGQDKKVKVQFLSESGN